MSSTHRPNSCASCCILGSTPIALVSGNVEAALGDVQHSITICAVQANVCVVRCTVQHTMRQCTARESSLRRRMCPNTNKEYLQILHDLRPSNVHGFPLYPKLLTTAFGACLIDYNRGVRTPRAGRQYGRAHITRVAASNATATHVVDAGQICYMKCPSRNSSDAFQERAEPVM